MKNKKSNIREDLKNLIDESHDFLSALNKGASSDELNEIKQRIRIRPEDETQRIDRKSEQSPDEAA